MTAVSFESIVTHWGIENSLHGVLDVTFDEDQSRTRNQHLANHLSWLRRFAEAATEGHVRRFRMTTIARGRAARDPAGPACR